MAKCKPGPHLPVKDDTRIHIAHESSILDIHLEGSGAHPQQLPGSGGVRRRRGTSTAVIPYLQRV